MKYCVHGFFQPRAVELGLTNDSLLVLRWFVDFTGTDKMRKVIIEGEDYYWIKYNAVLEDLPVLNITEQTLRKQIFGNLCNANVLKRTTIKGDGGTFSYFCYGINYATLQYLQEESAEVKIVATGKKIPMAEVKKYPSAKGRKLPTKDNNTNPYPNTTHQDKKVSKPQGGVVSFDTLIDNYTSSEELKTALLDFIKMRKLNKKLLTNKGLELIFQKLDNAAATEADKIAVLNQSIINCWQGIFPLKSDSDNIHRGKQPRVYD